MRGRLPRKTKKAIQRQLKGRARGRQRARALCWFRRVAALLRETPGAIVTIDGALIDPAHVATGKR